MTATSIDQASIDLDCQQADAWLKTLTESRTIKTRSQAYRALRAVLHHVRDRVSAERAADIGARLPTLIRGIYFEGWTPAVASARNRSLETVLESIGARLTDHPEIDREEALVAVVRLLKRQLSETDIDLTLAGLPGGVRTRIAQPDATCH